MGSFSESFVFVISATATPFFLVIFLLEGEMGGRGWRARSGGQAFLSLCKGPKGARAWPGGGSRLPPALYHPPWLPGY